MTVNATSSTPGAGDGSVYLYTWALTTANPDGAPIQSPEWIDRFWQGTGTFGGATLSLQGSNDNVNWFSLSNAAGGATVALTASGAATTIENPLYVRPNLTVVGIGATVTVQMLCRRSTSRRV